jgi:hypothetical protein
VLVALFGSNADPLALRLAALLASSGRMQALRLLEVPRDQPLPTVEESERLLDAERKRLGRLAGTMQVESARQPCAHLLESVAKACPTLLMLSAPLPTGEALEPLVRRTLQDAPGDTLVAHLPSGADPLTASVVVVPLTPDVPLTAGSERWLTQLATQTGIAVRLQGILEVPRSLPTDVLLLEGERELTALLAETAMHLRAAGVQVSHCLKRTRSIADELLRVATEPHAVVFLDAGLNGQATELWEHATDPILVCRTKK